MRRWIFWSNWSGKCGTRICQVFCCLSVFAECQWLGCKLLGIFAIWFILNWCGCSYYFLLHYHPMGDTDTSFEDQTNSTQCRFCFICFFFNKPLLSCTWEYIFLLWCSLWIFTQSLLVKYPSNYWHSCSCWFIAYNGSTYLNMSVCSCIAEERK